MSTVPVFVYWDREGGQTARRAALHELKAMNLPNRSGGFAQARYGAVIGPITGRIIDIAMAAVSDPTAIDPHCVRLYLICGCHPVKILRADVWKELQKLAVVQEWTTL